jgi:hypothetical protein
VSVVMAGRRKRYNRCGVPLNAISDSPPATGGAGLQKVTTEDRCEATADLGPNADRTVSPTLDRLVPEYDAHEEIYTAAMAIGSHENDVGFLFGMMVGERRAAMRVPGGA